MKKIIGLIILALKLMAIEHCEEFLIKDGNHRYEKLICIDGELIFKYESGAGPVIGHEHTIATSSLLLKNDCKCNRDKLEIIKR